MFKMEISKTFVPVLTWLLLLQDVASVTGKTRLHILGLYPMTGGWAGGEALLPATQLALTHINANDSILKEYELILHVGDTGCDGGRATDALFRQLYDETSTKIMVLGCGCSISTLPTAESSHLWNLIQVSYGAFSPRLSDRTTYPMFFRMVPPESVLNVIKIAIIKYFGWKKVATINPAGDTFTVATNDFRERAEKAGIQVLVSETFTDDPTVQMANIKKQGARIIVGNFYSDQARKVFCRAYKEGLYGSKYVWIIPGYYAAGWWKVRDMEENFACSITEMKQAIDGYFGVHLVALPQGDEQLRISGLSADAYQAAYDEFVNYTTYDLIGIEEAPFGYDAAWVVALALDKAERYLNMMDPPRSISQFDYNDNVMADLLFSYVNATDFEGVTGTVKFTQTGDRLGPLMVEQNQDEVEKMVGFYDPGKSPGKELIWTNEPVVKWQGGRPPVDSFIHTDVLQTISFSLVMFMTLLSTIGIVLAVLFVAFNIAFGERRIIKMSSPRLNNLICVGAILVYLSVICLGLDSGILSEKLYVDVSQAFSWCLVLGFSLSLGAMFSKTWRVHKIFTSKSVVPKRIRDNQLIGQVFGLVIVDVLVLTSREIFDPTFVVVNRGMPKINPNNDDEILTPVQITTTHKWQSYWLGIIFTIHGLLLIFGAFLAWETRKVTMPALNDSKIIGMCVYTVLIISFTGVPVSLVVKEPNAHFAIIGLFIIFATTLTLCMVFIPKVKQRNEVYPSGMTTMHTDNNISAPAKNTVSDGSNVRREQSCNTVITLGVNMDVPDGPFRWKVE